MDRSPGKAWFVPLQYGYGAVPASWQGWALIAAIVASDALLAWLMVLRPVLAGQPMTVGRVGGFMGAAAFLVGLLMIVMKAKTAGEWAWRSGSDR